MESRGLTSQPWLALGMIALGTGLIANTALGPLMGDAIDYPFSETIRNETLGLEAISLVLVAPLAIIAGWLALRGHPAAGVLALGPASYAAYMMVQYALGPQYLDYQPAMLLHIGLFALSGAMIIGAWQAIDAAWLPARSRAWAALPFLLGAFALSRWGGAVSGFITMGQLSAAPQDATMYWSILFLDLGIVIPLTLAVGLGLIGRQSWATRALYGVVGWFALVPPSIVAMALVKILRDDPLAVPGDAVVLGVAAAAFALLAAWLYRPLFRHGSAGMPAPSGSEARDGPRSCGVVH